MYTPAQIPPQRPAAASATSRAAMPEPYVLSTEATVTRCHPCGTRPHLSRCPRGLSPLAKRPAGDRGVRVPFTLPSQTRHRTHVLTRRRHPAPAERRLPRSPARGAGGAGAGRGRGREAAAGRAPIAPLLARRGGGQGRFLERCSGRDPARPVGAQDYRSLWPGPPVLAGGKH